MFTLIINAIICMIFPLLLLQYLGNKYKDASIIDIFWGLGFVLIFWVNWFYVENNLRILIFGLMISTWGIRLSAYIYWRHRNKGEDKRYVQIRRAFASDKNFHLQTLGVFSLQIGLIILLSFPTYLTLTNPQPHLCYLEYLAISIWLIGFLFESIADYQMYSFKTNPKNKGRVCDNGLWHYSRHPNYFGESLIWLGYGIYNLNILYFGIMGIIASAVMIYLILKISGVTMLDNFMIKNYPKKYREYVGTTSAFFPLPKKRK